MPKLLTARRRRARELRDACLMLVARHGLASQQGGGAPVTEVVLDPFLIRLAPSGARRQMDVWHAGTGGGAKVLSLWWSGEDFIRWSASAAVLGSKNSSGLVATVPPYRQDRQGRRSPPRAGSAIQSAACRSDQPVNFNTGVLGIEVEMEALVILRVRGHDRDCKLRTGAVARVEVRPICRRLSEGLQSPGRGRDELSRAPGQVPMENSRCSRSTPSSGASATFLAPFSLVGL